MWFLLTKSFVTLTIPSCNHSSCFMKVRGYLHTSVATTFGSPIKPATTNLNNTNLNLLPKPTFYRFSFEKWFPLISFKLWLDFKMCLSIVPTPETSVLVREWPHISLAPIPVTSTSYSLQHSQSAPCRTNPDYSGILSLPTPFSHFLHFYPLPTCYILKHCIPLQTNWLTWLPLTPHTSSLLCHILKRSSLTIIFFDFCAKCSFSHREIHLLETPSEGVVDPFT